MAERQSSEFGAHWKTLLGCWLGMAIGVHSLAAYTLSLFIPPLQQEFGWSRLQVSAGSTILIIGLGISSPIVGILLDRGYTRAMVCASALALALGFLGLSQIRGDIGWFYATIGLMAFGGAACCTPAFGRVINATFDRVRGTALGITMSSNGLVAMISPPIVTAIIAGHGWRSAYIVLGIVTAVVVPLLWMTLPNQRDDSKPREQIPATGTSLRGLWHDRIIWMLGFSAVAVAIGASGLVVHLVPLLTDAGIPPATTSIYASAIGLSVFAARLGTGALVDRYFAPYVAALLFSASAIGLFSLAIFGAGAALAGAVAVGLSVGAEIDLIGYLTARYFGMKAYGRIFAGIFTCYLVGAAISPVFYGWTYATTGNYTSGLICGGSLLLITAAVLSRLPSFPVEDIHSGAHRQHYARQQG